MPPKRLLVFHFLLIVLIAALPAQAQSLPDNVQLLLQFGGFGGNDGEFNGPQGITIDKTNNVYVVDSYNRRIQKFNSKGQFLKRLVYLSYRFPTDIAIDGQENIYIVDRDKHFVQKLTSNGGLILATFGTLGPADGQLTLPTRIALDPKGNLYVLDFGNQRIQKFNSSGEFLSKIITGREDGQINNPIGITTDTVGNLYVLDRGLTQINDRIQKFSSSGQFLSQFVVSDSAAGITLDAAGNFYVSNSNSFIEKYNSKGQFLFRFGSKGKINGQFDTPNCMVIDKEGHLYVSDYYVQKFAIKETFSSPNYIKGRIYNDTNKNCVQDTSEKGIAGMVVVSRPGNYFTSTDLFGNYTLAVGTGDYTIEQIIPDFKKTFIKQACPINPATHSVRFTASNDSVLGKDFANQLTLQPHLSVSVSSGRRRRCFINTTTIAYCNNGTVEATDTKVYVKLPEYVVLKSASVNYTRDKDSSYVFTLGSLGADACGNIIIQDSVVCDNPDIRGLSQCTTAWITPVNNRSPSDQWDQSDISLKATCIDNGRVRLGVYNMGNGHMADSSSFRIFLDAKLALISNFKLAKGDSLILQVPANGQTLRLEADQCPFHPFRKQSHITIEACGTNSNGTVSLGYVNQQVQEEEEPEIATQCLPIIDSFDPNDKAVSPQGVGNEHYTPTNKALEYLIRFQNTGTDIAYKVVVVDTLSEHVDISTLQVGAVSHAYKMSLTGKGKPVLTFTFTNINLPDSTSDQAGSNGYIRFSIKPKADLPKKTRIENFADIFFDYNEPVRTNTTISTIYDVPPTINPSVKLDNSVICTVNTIVDAGMDMTLCEVDSLSVNARNPISGKGHWKLIKGSGVIKEAFHAYTQISGLSYGENMFEWSVSANSCGSDSLRAQITITRLQKPLRPVITQVGADSLVCNVVGDSYQWQVEGVDLNINSQRIKAEKAGNYTIRVENQQGCTSDLSVPFSYVLTSTEAYLSSLIKLYPNPTTGKITLILPADLGQRVEVSLWDAIGRNILRRKLITDSNQPSEIFDLSAEKPGVYLFKIQTYKQVILKRVIKK